MLGVETTHTIQYWGYELPKVNDGQEIIKKRHESDHKIEIAAVYVRPDTLILSELFQRPKPTSAEQ
jgi:hypothetical protein